MSVDDLLSVEEAAHELSVNSARVRALLAAGELEGERVGGRWLVHAASVRRRRREPRERGRRLSPANAWAVLFFASGRPAPWVRAGEYSRLLRLLAARGLADLAPRLANRATHSTLIAHPGVLRRLAADDDIVLSGVSAAATYELDLVAGDEIDGYVRSSLLGEVRSRFALSDTDGQPGNVTLRVVPDHAWHLVDDAPLAAVALDLAEEADPRSARLGGAALRRLDAEPRWAAFVRPRGRPRLASESTTARARNVKT